MRDQVVLYVVGHEGRELWLAQSIPAARTRASTPTSRTSAGSSSKSLGQDFHGDCELDWTAVDEHTARTIISAGAVGALDESLHDWLLAKLAAETDQRDVEDVLG